MIVNMQYKASSGNTYNLQSNGLLTRVANYHAWEWVASGTTLQYGQRISDFSREPAVYTTQLVFRGPEIQRKAMVEALHDDFELDVRNMTPGRLTWGDYYIDCYITASSMAPDDTYPWTNNDISVYCPYPFWIQEETKQFFPQEAPEGEEYLDYDIDYAYDYYYGQPGYAQWTRTFPWSSEFRLIFYGPSSNPQISINGHSYLINDTLEESDYVVVDSRNHTVTKYLANGQTLNIFDLRGKTESVFAKMPGGTLTMNWAGAWGFDITLYEERSEPRWIQS